MKKCLICLKRIHPSAHINVIYCSEKCSEEARLRAQIGAPEAQGGVKVNKSTEVGSTMEQYRDQGYENLVVNKRIDPVKNWGIAVADTPVEPKDAPGKFSRG